MFLCLVSFFTLTCASNVYTRISLNASKHFVAKKRNILRICTILRVVITLCTHMIRLGFKLKYPCFAVNLPYMAF